MFDLFSKNFWSQISADSVSVLCRLWQVLSSSLAHYLKNQCRQESKVVWCALAPLCWKLPARSPPFPSLIAEPHCLRTPRAGSLRHLIQRLRPNLPQTNPLYILACPVEVFLRCKPLTSVTSLHCLRPEECQRSNSERTDLSYQLPCMRWLPLLPSLIGSYDPCQTWQRVFQ